MSLRLALALVLALSVTSAPDAQIPKRGGRLIVAMSQDLPRLAIRIPRRLWRQYAGWLGRVAHGDVGRSVCAQQPVRDLIAETLPATLLLTTSAPSARSRSRSRRQRRRGEAQRPRRDRARRCDSLAVLG